MKTNMQKTSLVAYFDEVVPTLGERHREVFKVFTDNPSMNFTNMELADELGWSINRVTPRVYELRGLGRKTDKTGVTRENPLKKKPILVKSELRECRITERMVNAWGLNYERFS
ncbi:MAG: hypothetical protein ACTSRU_12735 [Candidatus Hodarchaeales archaeon]